MKKKFKNLIFLLLVCLLLGEPTQLYAQDKLVLPKPGIMVKSTGKHVPLQLKGLKIDPMNPFAFDFVLDLGHETLTEDSIRYEADKLIKYFLAALTIPEQELWVNLSPYESQQIIPGMLGTTQMGRDLLAQDYILKQASASLIHPQEQLGKEFWGRIYQKSRGVESRQELNINTFNKVWIIPDRAIVYQHDGVVYIGESHLKVLLEEDYLAKRKNLSKSELSASFVGKVGQESVPQIMRDIVIPALEKEINEGRNFENLRQIYSALILAKWYKQTFKDNVISQQYVNKRLTSGVRHNKKDVILEIYEQYLRAFKKGVFDFIIENDPINAANEMPRRYFAGGARMIVSLETRGYDQSMLSKIPVNGKLARVTGEFRPEGLGDVFGSGKDAKKKYWFEGVDRSSIEAARKSIFGDNVAEWMEMHRGNGKAALVSEAVRELLDDPNFIEDINNSEKSDVPIIIIQHAIRKDLYLQTKSLNAIFVALRKKVSGAAKNKIPHFSVSINKYIQIITALAMQYDFLESEKFRSKIKKDKLYILAEQMKKQLQGVGIEMEYLSELYNFLPTVLSKSVRKSDLYKIKLTINDFVNLRRGILSAPIQQFLDSDELEKYEPRKRLDILIKRMNHEGIILESKSFGDIFSALPDQLSPKRSKKYFRKVDMTVEMFESFDTFLKKSSMQEYLDSNHFVEGISREDKLAALVKEMIQQGFNFKSVNLGQIYSGLPRRLSSRVLRKHIMKVDLTLEVFENLRKAVQAPETGHYINSLHGEFGYRKVSALDLIHYVNQKGMVIPENISGIFYGLPVSVRKYVDLVKREYRTDSDGRLIVSVARGVYHFYDFKQYSQSDNGFWANKRVVPLWGDVRKIVAFEVEGAKGTVLTISASKVIEKGMPTMDLARQYVGQEVRDEIVSNAPLPDEKAELNEMAGTLVTVIKNYLGQNSSHDKVLNHIDFLMRVLNLRQTDYSANEILNQSIAGNLGSEKEAEKFLRYLYLPEVRKLGIRIEMIIPPKLVTEILAQVSKEVIDVKGGIDFNPDFLKVEDNRKESDRSMLTSVKGARKTIIAYGLTPVIKEILPMTSLQDIQG